MDIVAVVGIISKLGLQWGMDSSLVYHGNVSCVAEVRRTCVYVCNKKAIKFTQ